MTNVRYPVVRLVEAQRYVLRRQNGELGIDDRPEYEEEGPKDGASVLSAVVELTERISQLFLSSKSRFTSGVQRDRFEGSLAVQLHEQLRGLPAFVLTDDDFWRFVAVRGLYDFISWRDGQSNGRPALASFGASSPRVNYDCVPFRMFVRADISMLVSELDGVKLEPIDLSSIAGTDVWRSHILRSQSSFAPHYIGSLLEHLERGVLPSGVVRDLAKRVKRVRSNVLIEMLEPEDSNAMFARVFAAARTEGEE